MMNVTVLNDFSPLLSCVPATGKALFSNLFYGWSFSPFRQMEPLARNAAILSSQSGTEKNKRFSLVMEQSIFM